MSTNTDRNLKIVKGIHESAHFHPEMELIFVIEGNMTAEIRDKRYHLKKEDLILMNSGVTHSLEAFQDTIFCCVRYSYEILSEVMENENCIFTCNSVNDTERNYEELRKICRELMYQYVKQTHSTQCLLKSLLFKLLDCLIENYRLDSNMENMSNADNDVRLQQIFQYVSRNFRYSLSLSELAERMFVSTATLSRFFKKQTGIYFADYVKNVRVRYAMQELLYSDSNITKIAVDCGFSNPSVFNKAFRDIYGLSPSDYRRQKKAQAQEKEDRDRKLREELLRELKERQIGEKRLSPAGRISVAVDPEQGAPYRKNWNKVLNIGSVYNLTLANLQYHTLHLMEQLGFGYVRVWNVFSRKLMISDGKRIGGYNYDKLDVVLDFLVSHHALPFLDLGRRPDTAIKSEGQSIFYEEEYIDFGSREIWEAQLKDFIHHIVKRYGKEEVSQWIFELSRDSNHERNSPYYQGEGYDYFRVFRYAYGVIKSVVKDAQVGGPMGIIEKDQVFLKRFLTLCVEHDCVPDFVSFLLFPYETKETGGTIVYKRAVRENFETEQIEMMREILDSLDIPKCKLYITEWNNSISNRNYLNDSCFRAAYIARKLSEIGDSVDLISIWMGSDWVSSYYDTVGIANGGSGILTKDSIRKPAYFALQFMNELGDTLLSKGDHYIITRKGKQSYYMICFNFKWYSSNYFLRDENIQNPEVLADIFEDDQPVKLEIELEDMPVNEKFIIKRRTVNREKGSILSEWKRFQYENDLDGSDVKYLRETCIPGLSMEKRETGKGRLQFDVTLQEHEISMIHIYQDLA